MSMNFMRKLPIPQDIKKEYPLSSEGELLKNKRDEEIAQIFRGESDKLIMIIGPCSADREDAVMEYIYRLARVQEQIKDKIFIIPRIYTNKPRTNGTGYKGMVHQPDPTKGEDMLEGLISIRKLHRRAIEDTGFVCAEKCFILKTIAIFPIFCLMLRSVLVQLKISSIVLQFPEWIYRQE